MTTEEKVRWLAEQAGWRDTKLVRGRTLWEHSGLGRSFELPDYPNSLDAIARDLLTRHGLARYSNGLWNDAGPVGAGYGITTEGQQAANALLEMEMKRIGASTQKED